MDHQMNAALALRRAATNRPESSRSADLLEAQTHATLATVEALQLVAGLLESMLVHAEKR